MNKVVTMVLAVCMCLLSGCAGAYGDYYHQVSIAVVKNKQATPELHIAQTTPYINEDTLSKYGLHLLGYSSFVGYYNSNTTVSCAVEQGTNVDADIVIVTEPKLLNSVTRLVPVTHQATVTSNNNSTYSGSVYGNNASIYYNGQVHTQSDATIQYETNEYRTFNTYVFHALYLERLK